MSEQGEDSASCHVYTIKIPRGLRALLNDLVREVVVCESSPDRLEETQILEFCANFLENRLEEREATKNMEVTQKDDLESDETDSNTERHKTLNLSAIDSDSGVETTGPPSFLTPSSTNVEETADDGGGDAVEMALRRLEAAGVADDWDDRKLYDLISKGPRGLRVNVRREPDSKVSSTKGDHKTNENEKYLKDHPGTAVTKKEKDLRDSAPSKNTAIPGRIVTEYFLRKAKKAAATTPEDHEQRRRLDHSLRFSFTLLSAAEERSSHPVPFAVVELSLLQSGSKIKVAHKDKNDNGVVASAVPIHLVPPLTAEAIGANQATPIHSITSDLPASPVSLQSTPSWPLLTREGEERVATTPRTTVDNLASQRGSSQEQAISPIILQLPPLFDSGGGDDNLTVACPAHHQEPDNFVPEEGLLLRVAEKEVATTATAASAAIIGESKSAQTEGEVFRRSLTESSCQTEVVLSKQGESEGEDDGRGKSVTKLSGKKLQSLESRLLPQDDVVARVLLEHAGSLYPSVTATESTGLHQETNYLDLSKLGEEGETPASDEIWLAVEDEEEIDKGFLTSSSSSTASSGRESVGSTVETDKLSTAATMAGHVAQGATGTLERQAEKSNSTLRDELYVDVTARLHGVLAEELLPIQNALTVTEKNLEVLSDKFQRLEDTLVSVSEKMHDDAALETLVSRMESLSSEMTAATTSGQLKEDNHQLRRDLDCYRQREQHLTKRIEKMEKMMQMRIPQTSEEEEEGELRSSFSSSTLSRPQSRRESLDMIEQQQQQQQFPPITAKSRTKRSAKEEIEVIEAIGALTKSPLTVVDEGDKSRKTSPLPPRRNSKEYARGRALPDSLQTEIQIARSDNVILRQDLQVFRERESQLVKRNKELEDKLLKSHRTAAKDEVTVESRAPLQTAPSELISVAAAKRKAELDINIDFTPPGKAVISRRKENDEEESTQKEEQEQQKGLDQKSSQGSSEEDKKEGPGKLPDQPPPVTKTKVTSGANKQFKATDSRSNVRRRSRTDDGSTKKKEKAVICNEDMKITVTTKHELEVDKTSSETVVISPRKPKAETKADARTKEPTPARSFIKPEKKSKLAKVVRKPVAAALTSPPQGNSDTRSDILPKPGPFPSARPPRDYTPLAQNKLKPQRRTGIADLVHQAEDQSVDKGPMPSSSSCELLGEPQQPQQQQQQQQEVVQMLIGEEPTSRDLQDAPPPTQNASQVRESPDGENSSALESGGTATAVSSIAINAIKRIPSPVVHEFTEDTPKPAEDILMNFVLMEAKSLERPKKSPQTKRKHRDSCWPGGKRRPAIIRRPKKYYRSRSLSHEKLSNRLSPPFSKMTVAFRSSERLSRLSPFDEERIVWMKNMEDDIQDDEDRRARGIVRRAAVEVALEDLASVKHHKCKRRQWDTSKNTATKVGDFNSCDDHDELKGEKAEQKSTAAEEDVDKYFSQTPVETHASITQTVGDEQEHQQQPPLITECFLLSRGWPLDQGRLLRALDRIQCSSFARVQVTSTPNRLSDSVRATGVDAVIVHLGGHELADAAQSLGNSDGSKSSVITSIASSVASVLSRQLLRAAGQHRQTQFVVSLPVPHVGQEHLRMVFCNALRATCSTSNNVQFVDNDNLGEHVNSFSGLTAAGVRKLAKNWEKCLRRLIRTPDGQLIFRRESSSESGGSSAKSINGDQGRVPWKSH